MNILFTNFHPNNGGGHTTYIYNLLRCLQDRHTCHLAVPPTSRLYKFAGNLGKISLRAQSYPRQPIKSFSQVKDLRRYIKDNRIEVIHANGSLDHRYAVQACLGMSRRPRIVWTKHNTMAADSFGNKLRAMMTDRVISVSDYVSGILERSAYKKLPIDMIHHGVDTNYFSPVSADVRAETRAELCRSDHADLVLIGSTGGTDHEKGWKEMVQAVAALPDELKKGCRVVVAGSKPKPEVMAWLQQLGMHDVVIFPGLLDDPRNMLGACDVGFVLSHEEALSYACRESMSLGLPTIVSDAGGLPENVSDGQDGWIVPTKNVEALGNLLSSILPDKALMQSVGSKARQKAESKFTLQRFCEKTEATYYKALERVT